MWLLVNSPSSFPTYCCFLCYWADGLACKSAEFLKPLWGHSDLFVISHQKLIQKAWLWLDGMAELTSYGLKVAGQIENMIQRELAWTNCYLALHPKKLSGKNHIFNTSRTEESQGEEYCIKVISLSSCLWLHWAAEGWQLKSTGWYIIEAAKP